MYTLTFDEKKVYVVHGCLETGVEGDSTIYGVFDSREKAIDYAIRIAVNSFERLNTPPKNRECGTVENFYITDNFSVWISVCEQEVQ